MYQSEAMWMSFTNQNTSRPVAVRVFSGGVNSLTGLVDLNRTKSRYENVGRTQEEREDAASCQDYVVVPGQPWLDGFASSDRTVRYVYRYTILPAAPLKRKFQAICRHAAIQWDDRRISDSWLGHDGRIAAGVHPFLRNRLESIPRRPRT